MVRRTPKGLLGRYKLVVQVAVGLGVGVVLYLYPPEPSLGSATTVLLARLGARWPDRVLAVRVPLDAQAVPRVLELAAAGAGIPTLSGAAGGKGATAAAS